MIILNLLTRITINYDNINYIKKLINSLNSVMVSKSYFDHVYSSQNISIEKLVHKIEDNLMIALNICKTRNELLKEKLFNIEDNDTILSLTKDLVNRHINDIKEGLTMEKKTI